MLPHVLVTWERQWPSVLLLGEQVTPVAGATFCQDALRAVVERSGQPARASFYVWLVREPDNVHDPLAVRVVHNLFGNDGAKFGYLKRELAATVAHEVDDIYRQTGTWPRKRPASC